MHASDTDSRSIVSRRRVLAGGAGLLALTSDDPARAEVVMGEFSVSSDSATVDGPPERIDVTASGEYEITSNTVPEMTETTLQVHVGGEGQAVDDLDTQTAFDTAAGTFDLSADLYSHADVAQGDLMPAERGTTKTTDLLIRVVVSAVSGGSILAEDHVQDTTTVTLDYEGVVVALGGEGAVEVVDG